MANLIASVIVLCLFPYGIIFTMKWFDFSQKGLPKTILILNVILFVLFEALFLIQAFFTSLWFLPLWWAIGGIIATLNYLSIFLQTKWLQEAALTTGKKGFGGNLYILRLTLSGLGLFLAAYLENDENIKLWAIGTVFVAYLLNSFMILLIGNLIPNKNIKS